MHQAQVKATKNLSAFCSCAIALSFTWPALAQQTTAIKLVNVIGTASAVTTARPVYLGGTGAITPFGSAAVSFNGFQDQSQTANFGLVQGTFTFSLNRLDSFDVRVTPQPVGKTVNVTLPGAIVGGTGTFSGATGSVTYTFKYNGTTSSSGTFTLTGAGTITVAQTPTAVTLAGFSGAASIGSVASGMLVSMPTGNIAAGNITPFGNVTVNFNGAGDPRNTPADQIRGALTFVFSPNDSFIASFLFAFNRSNQPISLPATITGGTGKFSGATGSLPLIFTINPDSTFTLTGSGTIVQPPPGSPIVTLVQTSGSTGINIAQNTFIEIKGTSLVPANAPASGVVWSNAPEFASGRMPTQLDGIGVKVNGKPAYVYFFCSAATAAICPSDQIDVLTPLDNTVGQVQVVVTNGSSSSAPFDVNLQTVMPSFLLFNTKGYIVATHSDFSLLGPTSLYPTSKPARIGEPILLYGVGFGLPSTPLVDGASTQSGQLPVQMACTIGTVPVTASGFLTYPGEYVLSLTVPSGVASGDNPISCTYNGLTTPAGDVITIQ